MLFCSCELIQETHIAGVELANFADAVLHHGDALDAHAEGEAGDLFWIVGVVGGVELAAFFGDGGRIWATNWVTTQRRR